MPAPPTPTPAPVRSPLESPEAWDLVADAYVADLLPMFEHFANAALQLAAVPTRAKVLDVATGPGTLALLAAARGAQVTAIDFSSAMIRQLSTRAAQAGALIDVQAGDGQCLPFASAHFDRAFSMFGLMFFPDRAAGLRELLRVLRPGGRAVIGSWAPFTGAFATALASVRAHLPSLPLQGPPPLSDPRQIESELKDAGFAEVAIHPVTHALTMASAAEFWASIQRATAPVVILRQRMGEAAWAPIARAVGADIERQLGPGPVADEATAYLAVASKGG
jgi:SAM-dependent methyltransferase